MFKLVLEKGYLHGCHCNFCGFKKYHYYSPILNRTITLLRITEIYHFIRFECRWADLQCIVFLYRPEYPSTLLSVHVTNVWTTQVLPPSSPHLLPHERWHGFAPACAARRWLSAPCSHPSTPPGHHWSTQRSSTTSCSCPSAWPARAPAEHCQV